MGGRDGCKVDDAVEEYGLTVPGAPDKAVDDHLLARWTGQDGQPPMGYRSLTEWFNKRLLKQVYDAESRAAIATRLDAEYDVLTGDDDLDRQELIRHLEANGIDASALLDDFVSWSTMRHHLKDCLDGEKERATDRSDWERDSIDAIRASSVARIEKVVRSLATKGTVPRADEARLSVDFQLTCPDCPTQVSLDRAVDRGYVCQTHRQEPESLISP